MNFLKVIDAVCLDLDTAGVRYALIGGFAMALRGVQRATTDLDFILMLQDLEELLSDYLALFRLDGQVTKMKGWYGTAE